MPGNKESSTKGYEFNATSSNESTNTKLSQIHHLFDKFEKNLNTKLDKLSTMLDKINDDVDNVQEERSTEVVSESNINVNVDVAQE